MNELGSEARGAPTCNEIFDEFMAHGGSRMSKNDFASAKPAKVIAAVLNDFKPRTSKNLRASVTAREGTRRLEKLER